jgi:putative oxidoreductase
MADIANTIPRWQTVTILLFRWSLGLLFLASTLMKLTSQPMAIAEFDMIGIGQWFRYVTGLLELIGVILLMWPRFSIRGALWLLAIDIAAFFTQIFVLHMDWIHPIVIGALLVALIQLQRRTQA